MNRNKKYFKPGTELPVFSTKFGLIGLMICYDLEFPEVARILKLNGAELILVPTSNMIPYDKHQLIFLQSRSLENEMPICLCNRIGAENEIIFFRESTSSDADGKLNQEV